MLNLLLLWKATSMLFIFQPSLSSDLHFPTVSSLRTTTERFLPCCKEKPRWFSSFSPPHLAGKRPRSLSATEGSNRWFSIISHQRSSRPPPSESSTSDLPESTIGWPEISPENFAAAANSNQWHFRNFLRNPRVFQSFTYTVALR